MEDTPKQISIENNPQNWDLDIDLDIIGGELTQLDLIKSMNNAYNNIGKEQQASDIADDLVDESNNYSQENNNQSDVANTNSISNKQKEEAAVLEESLRNMKDTLNEDGSQNESSTEANEMTVSQLIRELNILEFPEEYASKENLTDDDIKYLSQHTRDKREQSILDEMSSRLTNDYEKELFEYWKNPTTDKHIPEYKEMLDDIKYFSDLDVENPSNQKEVLTFFLRDGLDINNPAHAYRLRSVDRDVESIMSSDEATNQTEIARRHIQTKINTKRLEEKQRVTIDANNQQALQKQQFESSKQWFDSLNSHIEKQPWDASVKQSMFNELYGEVNINNNIKPNWLAKLDVINDSPELHIEFIKFINNFDMKTRKFKSNISEKEIKNAAVFKIKSLADRKIKMPATTSRINSNNKQQSVNKTVQWDPFF
jgi:hypothetical protein